MLTHGHEDHIGAVPYLLAHKPDIPLVGSQFTLALVEAKLAERRIKPYTLTVREGDASGSARSSASSSRSTTRSRTRSRSRSAPRPGWCCTPVTSRWTSCRWTGASPTWPASPGSAPRASTCCCRTRPTPRFPASSPRSGRSGRSSTRSSRRRPGGSSSRRSPRTCTACSRCSTPPREHGRKVALIGRSMVRNMGIARDLGPAAHPGAAWSSASTRRPRCRRTRSC